ncbi:potassium voltage-gated channel subfamily H member 5-like [Tachysurus ichikawai]
MIRLVDLPSPFAGFLSLVSGNWGFPRECHIRICVPRAPSPWHRDRAGDSCASLRSALVLSAHARSRGGARSSPSLAECLRYTRARVSQAGRSVTMVFSIPPTHPRPVRFISAISFSRVCELEGSRSLSAECTGEGEDWWRRRTLFWKTSSDAQAVSALFLASVRRDLIRHARLHGVLTWHRSLLPELLCDPVSDAELQCDCGSLLWLWRCSGAAL